MYIKGLFDTTNIEKISMIKIYIDTLNIIEISLLGMLCGGRLGHEVLGEEEA